MQPLEAARWRRPGGQHLLVVGSAKGARQHLSGGLGRLLSVSAQTKGDALTPNKGSPVSLSCGWRRDHPAPAPLLLPAGVQLPSAPFQLPSLLPAPPTHWLVLPPVFGPLSHSPSLRGSRQWCPLQPWPLFWAPKLVSEAWAPLGGHLIQHPVLIYFLIESPLARLAPTVKVLTMHPHRPRPESLGPLLSITSARGLPTCQHLLLLLGVLPATGRDQLWAKGWGIGQV